MRGRGMVLGVLVVGVVLAGGLYLTAQQGVSAAASPVVSTDKYAWLEDVSGDR